MARQTGKALTDTHYDHSTFLVKKCKELEMNELVLKFTLNAHPHGKGE